MKLIADKQPQIAALCKKHHVEALSLFGSVASGEATKESDIDFLVTFGQVDILKYADNYYELQTSLELLLGRKVDLISEKSITNPYLLKSINRNRTVVYERRNPGLAA